MFRNATMEDATMEDVRERPKERVRTTTLRTEDLKPNDYNPNRMTKEEFAELVEEVRHLGRVPKPVVVRNRYGRRRLRRRVPDSGRRARLARGQGGRPGGDNLRGHRSRRLRGDAPDLQAQPARHPRPRRAGRDVQAHDG